MAIDVIDNQRQRLADRVRDLLAEGAVAARFAVGYLFLDGLSPLRSQIERLDEAQILIGNVVNRLTEEQVREEAASRLRDVEPPSLPPIRDQEDMAAVLREAHSRVAAMTALNLRRTLAEMPRDGDSQALLLTLARRVADGGLKVRLYTHGRIHSKLTLLHYAAAPPLAIVGSSNLTLGGPAHPTELNLVVRDADSVRALAEWYENLWGVSQDFHRELFDELMQSWAVQPPPLSGGVAR